RIRLECLLYSSRIDTTDFCAPSFEPIQLPPPANSWFSLPILYRDESDPPPPSEHTDPDENDAPQLSQHRDADESDPSPREIAVAIAGGSMGTEASLRKLLDGLPVLLSALSVLPI